jgi:hypothetical protein
MTGPLRNLDLSQEIYFLISHISFIFSLQIIIVQNIDSYF